MLFLSTGQALDLDEGNFFAKSVEDIDAFVLITIFSGLGLLLFLSFLVLDQYVAGEWF